MFLSVGLFVSCKNSVNIVEQSFHNYILLHHAQGKVVRDQGRGGPHQGRAEDDCHVGDLHPVRLLQLCDANKMTEQK